MNSRKLLVALFIASFAVLSALPPVFAGDPARTGTAGGVQLLVPVGARDLAMGGANLATTSNLGAIYWNPAGLSSMSNKAAGQFSTMEIFNDIRVNYAAVAVQAGRLGHIGVSLKAFDFGDIPETTLDDPDGVSGRTFSPTFATLGLTYSRKLTDVIQVGFNAKTVVEEVPRASASAVAFDLGIQYHQLGGINGLSIGLAVKNIGSDLQYEGSAFLRDSPIAGTNRDEFQAPQIQSDQLPASIEMGVGYSYQVNESNSFIASGNFQSNNFGNDAFKFGGEYNYGDFFALRAGYLSYDGIDTDDLLYRYTFGAGLNFDVSGTALVLDYAFRDSQYFDSNHLFSLTVGF